MDTSDFKGLFNLVVLILFVAGAVLGPLVERWRRKKEAERRGTDVEPPPAPAPARDQDRPQLPYENVLEEVFGPYIERRRQAAEEARRAAEDEPPGEEEVDEDEEIRKLRVAKRPAEPAVAPEPEAPVQRLAEAAGAEVAHRKRARSLDEILFRNSRLSPGAKLVLAGEILGKPRARRR